MKFSVLTIRNGGIYPAPKPDQAAELRARAFLAHAHTLGLTKIVIASHIKEGETIPGVRIVTIGIEPIDTLSFDEIKLLDDCGVNAGFIYAPASTEGWSAQRGRMVLLLDEKQNVEFLIQRYFTAPIRWLQDRGFDRAQIEKNLQARNEA